MFYSHEHESIHVHCKFQGKESKAELIFLDGKFVEVKLSNVIGKEPLDSKNLIRFKKFVEVYREDIVKKWIDFFVYNKQIQTERITTKL